MVAASSRAEMEVLDFSWDEPAENVTSADASILLADSEVAENDTAAQSLISALHAQNLKGKPILGLGYGAAKLLADSGLLPGIYKNLPCLTVSQPGGPLCHPERSEESHSLCSSEILHYAQGDGEAAWMRLSEDYQYNAFTQGLSARQVLAVRRRTRAHFIIPPGLLAELQAQGQTVFFYCDAEGQTLPGNAIAAISNKAGNVMAVLAHPDAAASDLLLQALRAYLESGHLERVEPLCYWPRK
jgi:phosphoribosylformylglycinamidine (FGAM) synthase-like amidotransferase family enzyme